MSKVHGLITNHVFVDVESRHKVEDALQKGMFVRVREHHNFNWDDGEWDEPVIKFDIVTVENLTHDLMICIVESKKNNNKRMDSEDPCVDFYITKYLAPEGKQEQLDKILLETEQELAIKHNRDTVEWYNDQYCSLGF